MGSGTSRSSLTRDECKQHVPEDKWEESWDEFYFADGKSVSTEIAEPLKSRKSERGAAHVASAQAAAEPKHGGTMENVPESPREGVRDSDEGAGGGRAGKGLSSRGTLEEEHCTRWLGCVAACQGAKEGQGESGTRRERN